MEDIAPLHWIGSSRKAVQTFPVPVKDHVGFALFQAQTGRKHKDAKPLKGLGAGVLEIVSRERDGTFRTVYAVKFEKAVYVLHAFQKKSKSGIATPKLEIDLVRDRLKAAADHHAMTYGRED